MPTEQPKRLKTIKVRVTETEWASLRAACPKAQLAEWMRESTAWGCSPAAAHPTANHRSGIAPAGGRDR